MSAISDKDSTTAGAARLDDANTIVPSETATVRLASGCTTAMVSAMLYLRDLWVYCYNTFYDSGL